MFDELIPFTFEEFSVRGTLVRLSGAWKKVLEGGEASGDYSGVISRLLGEMLVSGLLLSSTLKLKGTLLIQILGEGPVSLLLVEIFVTEQGGSLGFRSMVKCNKEEVRDLKIPSMTNLVGNGTLSITLDPKDGSQSYQSIVPVSHDSVGEIFESYMHQSEQIRTRLLLCTSEHQVSGFVTSGNAFG
jgi:molecular chaperone Hsp33